MTAERILVYLALVLYLSGLALSIFKLHKQSTTFVLLGIALQATSLILRTIFSKHAPFSDIYKSFNFFSFCVIIADLVLIKIKKISKITLSISIILLILSLIFYKQPTSLPPALNSFWFLIHVPASFLSYGFFASAFSSALQMLFSKSKENEENLFDISYLSVRNAFSLLTVGIVTGSLWAKSAWGSYWSWDPKETSSLVLWFVYLFYFHLSNRKTWRGKKIALLLIFGFVIVIFTFIGLNFLPIESLHRY